jgi:hypothetical protein
MLPSALYSRSVSHVVPVTAQHHHDEKERKKPHGRSQILNFWDNDLRND